MNPADRSAVYKIRIEGQLDERWLRWFEGLVITQHSDGETTITGVMDQAALYGVLNRVRDLGLELISVWRGPSETEHYPDRNLE